MPPLDFGAVLSGGYLRLLGTGVANTLWLFGLSLPAALAIACLLAMAAAFAGRWPRRVVAAFVSYHRNTPLLIQLLVWNFGLSQALPAPLARAINADAPEFIFAVVTLTLYAAAYMSQDLMSGLNAVPRGQTEAAIALGLTPWQARRLVLLPQAWRLALPPLVGQCIGLFKATSIAAVIGVGELTNQARQIESETFRVIETFGLITAGYLVATVPLMLIGGALEQRLGQARGVARATP